MAETADLAQEETWPQTYVEAREKLRRAKDYVNREGAHYSLSLTGEARRRAVLSEYAAQSLLQGAMNLCFGMWRSSPEYDAKQAAL